MILRRSGIGLTLTVVAGIAAIACLPTGASAQVINGDTYAEWDFPTAGPSSAFQGGVMPATFSSAAGASLSLSPSASSVYSVTNSTMYGVSRNMLYGTGTTDPAAYLSVSIPDLTATAGYTRANSYTMAWNFWLPSTNPNGLDNWVGLYDSQYPNLGNNNHANVYVGTDGSIGSNGSYFQPTAFDSWHQYAVTVAPDAGNPAQLDVIGYIDGIQAGTIAVSNSAADQDYSLFAKGSGNPAALIFADNFSDTNYTDDMYLTSFAFVGRALSSTEMSHLVTDLSVIPDTEGNGTNGFGPSLEGILTQPLGGDANNDHVVNGLDINVIAQHWLAVGDHVSGDANGDGVVNGLDINIVAQNWLKTAGGGGVSLAGVPEPGSLVLALFAALGFANWRWKDRRRSL